MTTRGLENLIDNCTETPALAHTIKAAVREWAKSSNAAKPFVGGALPLDLVKVIASKSYRQGCFHLDDMDAGMKQFEKWYESEIKKLLTSGNDR